MGACQWPKKKVLNKNQTGFCQEDQAHAGAGDAEGSGCLSRFVEEEEVEFFDCIFETGDVVLKNCRSSDKFELMSEYIIEQGLTPFMLFDEGSHF